MPRPSDVTSRIDQLGELLKDGRLRSKLENLAIQRQLRDLEHGHERGLVWDESEVVRATEFFKLLKHWEGRTWVGRPFNPEPWQEQTIIAPLFGWYKEKPRKDGGIRRFRKGGIELPRKQGKTTLGAAIALQGLIADEEPGSQVYSAATTRDQANILFNIAKKMLNPDWDKKFVNIYKHAVECGNGYMKPLASDADTLHGLNMHRTLVDEMWAHKTRDVWDACITSIGTRTQPMVLWISTAGFDLRSIWWEEHQAGARLLEGAFDDDELFYYFTGIDDGDDWQDPKTWFKANPNLDITVPESFIKAECKRAERSPAYENTFRRLYLNERTEQAVRWIPMHEWDNCKTGHDLRESANKKELELELLGRDCFAGLDLASTRDLCAWVLVFPMPDGSLRTITRYFAPKEADTRRQKDERQSYSTWATNGHINLTSGSATYYNIVIKAIQQDAKRFNIVHTAIDPYNAEMFYQKLVSEGWSEKKISYFRQSYENFNEAMDLLITMVNAGSLDHAHDPVLRWMASNVVAKERDGYLRPDREKSQDKIDGIIALLMAMRLWIEHRKIRKNLYEKPGSLEL